MTAILFLLQRVKKGVSYVFGRKWYTVFNCGTLLVRLMGFVRVLVSDTSDAI